MADENPQNLPSEPENQDIKPDKPKSPSNENTTRDAIPIEPNPPVNLFITDESD